ncbi:MAG: hypothetical protein AAFZ89_14095, partial [Bacteroidota bacterium]
MKTLGLLLGLIFTGLIATAQENKGVTLTVTIENVLNDQGKVLASLHTDQTFMKGAGLVDLSATAKKGELIMTFENVEP